MSNLFSKILGIQLTNVSNPPSGKRVLYAKSDGWYDKNSAGTETKLLTQTGGQTKVYRATLTGSNGAVATTAVTENGLSAAIVWTYGGEGNYIGTLVGAFVLNKLNLQVSTSDFVVASIYRTSADVVEISTADPTSGSNTDVIGTIDVQITVAP